MATGFGLAPLGAFRDLMTGPTDPFRLLQDRINRLFDDDYTPMTEGLLVAGWTPKCDIYETEGEIVLKAELPEVKKQDVKVNLDGNRLEISGERKLSDEIKRENYHRVERRYGKFVRSFTLPVEVDLAKVNADFKDGILQVTMPKREDAKTKRIEVKVK